VTTFPKLVAFAVLTIVAWTAVGADAVDQAVLVRASISTLSNDELFDELELLEAELEHAIDAAQVGEFDGNEIGEGELVLYMYGPDAEKVLEAVAPILRRSHLTRDGVVVVRDGPPGADERTIRLSPASK